MRVSLRRGAAASVLLCLSWTAWAGGASVRFDVDRPDGAPFPSNRFTVPDTSQLTQRRVALPKPDCTVRPSDCADIDVINALDGFSTQPRITLPFDGDIDLATVDSRSIYLVNLGDTVTGAGAGERVGINQVLWDAATKTLVFESDALLRQHSRYLLVVTDRVRDTQGRKLKSGGFGEEFGHHRHGAALAYRTELRDALRSHRPEGGAKVVAGSVFTTQSITADLEKIGQQVRGSVPAPVDFMIAAGGAARAVFPVAGTAIQFQRQVGTAPSFATSALPLAALQVVPGAVGQVAYGRFRSPDYQTAQKFIPATATATGMPQRQGWNELTVQVFLPAGPKPAGGWPVAIFGHGFTDSMYGAPWTVASVLASRGLATVSINVVGHGGGAAGQLLVTRDGQTVTVPAGGRGIDQDGNGRIDSTEGVNAAAPRVAIGSRDGLRQTVVDLMQLVRQIQAGVDVDGDGGADLDAQRIHYAGQSFGGIYGTILLGVEPALKAGVPNVPGGSISEVARLGAFRGLTGLALAQRTPSLINVDPATLAFNENIPLRDLPPRVNTVPGALAIQEVLERNEWVQQSGNPASYAPHIRHQPLPGHAPKPVLIQFAQGDQTVPNPTTTAIVRAGRLQDRAVRFRNDLAVAIDPSVPKNPHTFLTNIAGGPTSAQIAVGAQMQIAVFFASGGTVVIDPDGAAPLFEVPATSLPEGLNYLP